MVANPALALPMFHVQTDASNAVGSSNSGLRGYPTKGQVAGAQRLVPLTTGWVV